MQSPRGVPNPWRGVLAAGFLTLLFGAAAPAVAAPRCPQDAEPPPVSLAEPVTVESFTDALVQQLDAVGEEVVRPAWEQFTARRGIDPNTPGLSGDFRRLRLLFEATRDGGWWRLRWDITNQEPSSQRIFTQWEQGGSPLALGESSAVAECDEVSALLAVLGRRIGVRGLGLFYPTWNHTIVAWAPPQLVKQHQRVVLVPTTQIFLGCDAGFDATTFRTRLTNIEEYPRWDVRPSRPMSATMARYLLEQVRAYAGARLELSELMRATRAFLMGSSVGACNEHRQALATSLAEGLTCGDRRALRHFASEELASPAQSPEATLAMLGWRYERQ